jgi:HSP90 family molecular chaperone
MSWKYINQVAFLELRRFLDKYKDSANSGIIGFGLGFYSAFMVAEKVEIITKSFKDEPAAHWTCDGGPEFTLEPARLKRHVVLKSFCILPKIHWSFRRFKIKGTK